MLLKIVFTSGIALLALLSNAAEKKMDVYFIGNSLTASTTLDRVHSLFEQRGIDLQFGSQLSGGKSLIRHLNYKKEPKQKWIWWECNAKNGDTYEPDKNPHHGGEPPRFGRYETGLAKHKWDAVVMQPYSSNLHDDLLAISAFIDICLKNKSTDKFYIYSTWPRRKKKKVDGKFVVSNLDYQKAWLAEYTASPDDTSKKSTWNCASRSYFKKLLELLNKKYPKLSQPIKIIPAGEVLFELDKMIKADKLPGIKEIAARDKKLVPGLDADTSTKDGVNILYADAVHLNPIPHKGDTVGIFVSGSTVFTVLSGENPVGMSGKAYGLDDQKDAALIKAIQETIWKVVQKAN